MPLQQLSKRIVDRRRFILERSLISARAHADKSPYDGRPAAIPVAPDSGVSDDHVGLHQSAQQSVRQPDDAFDRHLDHRYVHWHPHAERLARVHVFRGDSGQCRCYADIGIASDDRPATARRRAVQQRELHDRELDVWSNGFRESTAVGDGESWHLLCEGFRRWQPDEYVDRDRDRHASLTTRRRSQSPNQGVCLRWALRGGRISDDRLMPFCTITEQNFAESFCS